ncbi:trichohyalin-like [Coccinella septempunctata]|uniref:trichohyalin-like n=1 Tax=Coccinella septempunctata TaxID=41139 RepID=UPI001D081BEB|nr:trichohyalin-like [Coccinella septempunctata]
MKKNVNERIDRNIKIYVDYMSQIPSAEPSEEAIYQNGLRKNQNEYEKKLAETVAKQKKAAEDKIKNYKEDIRRQKMKTEEEEEMKRMEMIERYKKIEAMKYFDEANEKEELRRKKQYAEELLRQAEEQRLTMKHEKKLEEEYVFHSYSSQDDHFTSYADEVIRFAKQKRWPTAPIKRVIEVIIHQM